MNVPYGAFDPKILGVCGSKSGRDMDKAKELGLTLVDPEVISVPAVKELPLTLECRWSAWKNRIQIPCRRRS